MAISIGPEDYLGTSPNETLSFEEVQDSQLEQRSRDFANRKSYEPEAGDLELLALQSRYSRSENHVEKIQLEQQIQSLAESLTGASQEVKAKPAQTYDSKQEVINEFGAEAYNKTMQWAGDSAMSDATVASINEVLQSDSQDAVVAFQGLQDLSGLSEEAFTSADQVQHMSEDLANHLSERFGQSGEQLVTLNAALASGQAKPADVLKMALSNPKLRNAAMTAAREGLINIVL